MRFRIVGCERQTGDAVDRVIDAASHAAAEARAHKMGVVVESIAPTAPPPALPLAAGQLKGRNIICPNPNCGYRGASRREERGSVVLAVLLMLFVFIIPGLLYLIFMCGSYDYCPNCGIQVGKE